MFSKSMPVSLLLIIATFIHLIIFIDEATAKPATKAVAASKDKPLSKKDLLLFGDTNHEDSAIPTEHHIVTINHGGGAKSSVRRTLLTAAPQQSYGQLGSPPPYNTQFSAYESPPPPSNNHIYAGQQYSQSLPPSDNHNLRRVNGINGGTFNEYSLPFLGPLTPGGDLQRLTIPSSNSRPEDIPNSRFNEHLNLNPNYNSDIQSSPFIPGLPPYLRSNLRPPPSDYSVTSSPSPAPTPPPPPPPPPPPTTYNQNYPNTHNIHINHADGQSEHKFQNNLSPINFEPLNFNPFFPNSNSLLDNQVGPGSSPPSSVHHNRNQPPPPPPQSDQSPQPLFPLFDSNPFLPFQASQPPPPPPSSSSSPPTPQQLFQRRKLTLTNGGVGGPNELNGNSLGGAYPNYDFFPGASDDDQSGLNDAAFKWPKIFKFADGRVNINEFEKEKKLGRIKFNEEDDFLDNIKRDSFLILHGGAYQ